METWLLKRWQVSVCIIVTYLFTAHGDVYLHSHRNSSIRFSCVPPENPIKPFAVSLRRNWIQQTEVLYHDFRAQPTVKDVTFMLRISEQTDVNQNVNVSIINLRGDDTDMYVCVYHYNTPTGFTNLSVKDKIFLYVRDYHIEPCSCPSYTLLLFCVSVGAGLLFIISVSLALLYCASGGGQRKHPRPVPIYEEMTGVREKPHSGVQDEDMSLYSRPKKENPYYN